MEISNYVHIDARAESYNSRFITASITGRASNLYPVVYQTSSKYSEIRNFVFSHYNASKFKMEISNSVHIVVLSITEK